MLSVYLDICWDVSVSYVCLRVYLDVYLSGFMYV